MRIRTKVGMLGLALLGMVMVIRAGEQNKGAPGTAQKAELAVQEQQLSRQFEEFQLLMLKLKQRMERGNAEEQNRAKAIGRILDNVQKGSIKTEFDQLAEQLRTSRLSNTSELKELKQCAERLTDKLQEILAMFQDDPRRQQLREERDFIDKLLKQIGKTIDFQKQVQGQTERGKTDKNELKQNQNQVTKKTDDLTGAIDKFLGKKGDGVADEARKLRGGPKEGGKNEKSSAVAKGDGEKESQTAQGETKPGGDEKPTQVASAKGDENGQKNGKEGDAQAKQGKGADGQAKSGKESSGSQAKGNEGAKGNEAGAKNNDGAKSSEATAKSGQQGSPSQAKQGNQPQTGAKKGDGSQGSQAKANQGAKGNEAGSKNNAGAKSSTASAKPGQKAGGQGSKSGSPSQAKAGEGSKAGSKSGQGSQGSQAKSGSSSQGSKGGKSSQGQAKAGSTSKGQAQAKSDGSKSPMGQQGSQSQAQAKQDPADHGPQSTKTTINDGDGKSGGGGSQKTKDTLEQNRKRILEGGYESVKAVNEIVQGKKKPAIQRQDDVIKNLEEAKKELEKLLRQTREEELERLLAALEARCRKMLEMQMAVLAGTEQTHKAVLAHREDKNALRADQQSALRLSDDEKKIITEANKAIQMLEEEGSAVAFPEVFQQVREDMKHVQRRLEIADVAEVTQQVEKDIIESLKEMIEALKKAQQVNKSNSKGQAGQPPPNADQKLLDKIAELKMIRSLQKRVNDRTRFYGRLFPNEQALDPNIRQNLQQLAERQERIFEIMDRFAKGDGK